MTWDPLSDNAVKCQILPGHEPFTCVEYNSNSDSYTLHQWDEDSTREFYINKPVPYFDYTGAYQGMLQKGDHIKINGDNLNAPGFSRPWTTFINGIKAAGSENYNDFSGYVSVGIEYASQGSERAWY